MVNKRYLSANGYLEDSWHLSAQVRESGWRPDVLLALWRGGASVGVAMHEFFKLVGWGAVRHYPLKCASYTGIGESGDQVEFSATAEAVFAELHPGERVLVVDDVFDTGKTAAALKARLSALGVEMRLATVYWKEPCNQTDLKPDYVRHRVGDDWLVFPHEIEGLTHEELEVKSPLLATIIGGLTGR